MIVLIHGIADTGADMAPIATLLNGKHPTFAPTMLNHPGRPVKERVEYDELVEDLVQLLDKARINKAYLFGYSFGGFVAMTIAHRYPDRVKGVITLAGKFLFDQPAVQHIQHLFSPQFFDKLPPEVRESQQRLYGPLLPALRANCSRIYGEFNTNPPLTEDDLRSIRQPALLISGEQDQIVAAAESRHMAELLPNARLGLFPGPAHPIHRVPLPEVSRAVLEFIQQVEAGAFDPSFPARLTPRPAARAAAAPANA